MTAVRKKGSQEVVFSCDHEDCSKDIDTETDKWSEAVDCLRQAKWAMWPDETGSWAHYCNKHKAGTKRERDDDRKPEKTKVGKDRIDTLISMVSSLMETVQDALNRTPYKKR